MAVENQFDDTLGVFVSGVKRVGPAAEGGLRRGDVIREVNEIPVPLYDDFYNKYNELIAVPADKVLLTVRRFGNVNYVLLKINQDIEPTDDR
jgi:S1-C subfamily serine protease